jgi:hypothetical protein
MDEIVGRSYGIPSGPFRDLEKGRISGDEYAKRVRREVRERMREAPPPRRSDENGNDRRRQGKA